MNDLAFRWSLWCGALFGLVLPILFNIGYEWLDLEILTSAAGIAVIALAAAALPKKVAGIALFLIVAATIHIHYFPHDISWEYAAGLVGLLAVAVIFYPVLLTAAGAAGVAAAAFAGFSVVGFWTIPPGTETPASDVPSVIHLVLDEFAAPSGLPESALGAEAIGEASTWWTSRGFTTFENSYSLRNATYESLALLNNPGTDSIDRLLEKGSVLGTTGVSHALVESATLQAISEDRFIRSVTTNYFDLRPALAQAHRGSYSLVYNYRLPNPLLSHFQLSASERLSVLFGLVNGWLKGRQKVPLYLWWINTDMGRAFDRANSTAGRFTPLSSLLAFDYIIEHEIPAMKRGQYLVAHLLLPHFPYAFEADCTRRPVADWRNKTVTDGTGDTLESRAERYRLYIEQVACTRLQVDRVLEAARANSELNDAVIVVNGDHGSRIAIEKRDGLEGYSEDEYLRDWHAAFFAVRLPAREGRLVTKPVAIHHAYGALVDSNFQSLDWGSLPLTEFGMRLFGERP